MRNTLIIITALSILAGCSHNHPVDMTGTPSKKTYQTVQIEKGTLSSIIKLPAQLKPFEKVDIYPKVNGFVKEMMVDRGSAVHEGQVLMTLEAPEIDQQLQSAQSKLLQAREALNFSRDRYTRLLSAAKTPGAVSELDLVNARSKYQADSAFELSETANVSTVQTLKDYLVIKAPFDGVITERNVHPGSITGPNFKMDNKPLLVLQNNRKLRLEVFVPEEFVEKMDEKNRIINFTTQAYPGKVFTAAISRSSNSLYDDFRSEAIEADVPNADNTFKPGMYAEANLPVTSGQISYLVPSQSIITNTERKYILAVTDGKARVINITEGITNNGKTEVYGSFTGNEMIVENPPADIKDGDPIAGNGKY
jgi:RND family efflux transporter MFP subunit